MLDQVTDQQLVSRNTLHRLDHQLPQTGIAELRHGMLRSHNKLTERAVLEHREQASGALVLETLEDGPGGMGVQYPGGGLHRALVVGRQGLHRAQAGTLQRKLADAGASFDHVVKLNHYLIDLKAHQRLIGPIRAKYFIGRPQPASTTVQVGALVRPGALYEVEAVAIVPA